MVLDKLVEVVRATGRLGVVGVYNPQDPGAATEGAQEGRSGFNYGLVFDKGLSMGQGQCPVKRYNHQLRDLIIRGKARPSLIVSHELPLDQAADAYKNFAALCHQRGKPLIIDEAWGAHETRAAGYVGTGAELPSCVNCLVSA